MKLTADLHIHSRFSRATSKDLDFVALHRSALEKGIGLVGTGDFTHPGWMSEIKEQLVPAEEGWFMLRPELRRAAEETLPKSMAGEVRFVLQVEISNIYKKDSKTRKNHNLVFMPTVEAAEHFTQKLSAVGNLASDGRPILGLDARDLLEMTLETDPSAFLIPAHIWTPWFSMLGSKSGFDSTKECFSDLADEIFAVETGLSSDPPMNWRVRELDRMTLVSNSDAHSAAKLGREANLLDIEPGYGPMLESIKTGRGFLGTLEFFPEHGKYHMDGHRKCNLRLSPEETRALGGRCPVCGGIITVGVMSRVDDLSDPERPEGYEPEQKTDFESLVPLNEVAAEVLNVGASSNKVKTLCSRMLGAVGPELHILKDAPLEDIESVGGFPIREAIRRIRCKQMAVEAGFDGEFGEVKVFTPKERAELTGQIGFLVKGFAPKNNAPSKKPSKPKVKKNSDSSKTKSKPAAPRSKPVEHSSDPLAGLNEKQMRVVASADGPLIVSAGPGTGKTKTLTARIAHHVTQGTWQKNKVIALTFTNQAARELQERLAIALGDCADKGLAVMTFHGFGKHILETFGNEPVRAADDETRRALAAEALGEDASRRQVDKTLDAISLAKQSPDPLSTIKDADLRRVFEQYQSLLKKNQLLDVDDLVLSACELLEKNAQTAAQWADVYDAISVDEYQDVNDVQAALIKHLSPDGKNLLVIGDPDQAVYGFRGARPGHFARFQQEFEGARSVSLDTTYRLPRPVLCAAQSILGQQRELRSEKEGAKVEIIECPTENSEAEQLLVRIEKLLGGSSYFAVDSGRGGDAEEADISFGDIAVLCRLKAQRKAVQTALSGSGIPCILVGEDEPHDPRSEKVAVMTMHASKGREFEAVFIVGVEPDLMPLCLEGLSSDPEEERRLLYVAATRAKRRLFISFARKRMLFGKTLPGGPSSFLSKLSDECSTRSVALFKKKQKSLQLELF